MLAAAQVLSPVAALSQASFPDPSSTPGAVDPAVTQATISHTICRSGYAAAMRPPEEFTSAVKSRQLRLSGAPDGSEADFEEDHLIPLELGGAPADERNLWPQPRHPQGGWDASRKDELEGALHREVCGGRMPLAEAQHAVVSDWRSAWRRFVLERPEPPARVASAGSLHGKRHYESSDGTEVHVPTVDQGDFGHVTAICVDGTSSFSHHRRGTCSHHGGVSAWR